MEEQSNQMDSIDRISAMPVDILHHILSFLPTKAAGKTSLLSKRWLSVWDSYPVFDFSQDNPEVSSGYGLWTRYSDMVDSRIQKFCKLNFSIQKVKFNIVYVNFAFAYHFKYWMGLITEKNVKELDICIPSGKRNCYIIPQTVFSSNSLTVLKICSRCRLYMLEIDDYSRSSMNLPALRTLSLDFVKVSDMTIQHLISSCPCLEDLSLRFCRGFEELNLSGIVKLINVTLEGLQCKSCLVQLSNCQVLKRASFLDVSLDCVFDDHNFPRIEFISLARCTFARGIRISSNQLKSLFLGYQNLDKNEIFAPNLSSIVQVDRCSLNDSVLESYGHCITSILKPNVHYTLTLNVDLGGECQETPWFIKFKEFLQLRTTIRTLQININFNEITEFNKEEALNYCPSPYSLDHLIMEVVSSSRKMSQLDRAALFDGFLWCCHPIVLSFPLNHFSVQLLEFLCQTFEEDHVCCGSSEMKCWRHSLKKVKDVTVEDKNGIKVKVLFCWEHLSKVISGKRRVSLDLTW